MISIDILIPVAYILIFALILIRISYIKMVNTRNISTFLPFFTFGILFTFSAALTLLLIFAKSAWFLLEISYMAITSWILINLIRLKK